MSWGKKEDYEDVTVEFDEVMRDEKEDAAVLYNCSGEHVWLPRSQISHEDVSSDGSGCVCIPRWLARKKGLD